jgi:hypothetical protein
MTKGNEKAGILNHGPLVNIGGIFVEHGAVILLEESAAGLYLDDVGELHAPQSILDGLMEDFPWAYAPLGQEPVPLAQPEPVAAEPAPEENPAEVAAEAAPAPEPVAEEAKPGKKGN